MMLSLVALACACSRSEPEPVRATPVVTATATASAASATPSAAASAPAAALPASLVWTAPARFVKEAGEKPMRLATYHGPKVAPDTEEPTLVVAQAGGGLDANIERWMGQFSPLTKKARTERTVGPLSATIVEGHGAFSGMKSNGPKEQHMLLGAIFPIKDGGAFFFKLVGPEASVEALRADFDTLVASVHSAP